ncbi:MAG: NupC/NupG family nucleoside CNT transporter [Elusimicrobia bacterium]|nr:NupC/NupG family nucleoside CNT transporter [Elusimicrobiota bacterium]
MFAACGLFGALGTVAFSAAAPKEPAAASAPSQADQVRAQIEARAAAEAPSTVLERSTSFFGLFALVGLCWLMSTDRKKINWKLVAWGMALQLIFGIIVLKTGPGLWFFSKLNDGVMALLGFTNEGTKFLFGSFVTGQIEAPMINFAFNVLPTIIFVSALMTVGYHIGLMQWVVDIFAVVMYKTMKTSGAETLSTAANIFVGQTEAPLIVKPYVADMTNSELLAIMVGGFANTAGGVLAAYVGMLHQYFPDIAGHLIAQSVMSAPAALVCAKIAMPETGVPKTLGHVKMGREKIDANVIDAAARGASEGLGLAFNVAAMLLAFIALIAMLNAILKTAGAYAGYPQVSLEGLLALLGWPLAFLMGVPVQDCWVVGKLIGVKTVLNEFVAYLQLTDILKSGQPLSHRSVIIVSYALSGFANFSSIAIQIGGISGIAPTRRHDLAKLGLKAMVVGAIATFMTANIAGILIP